MFRSYLPFLTVTLSCLVQLSAAACGGEGQRACCAPSKPCQSGLNKVGSCAEELGKDNCKCGFMFSASSVCHAPPSSDEKNRMKEQHYIDYDVPLREAMFIGTHNSYNNNADGYPVPNNRVNLIDQLNLGLRVLNFDLHDKGSSSTPILCHDSGDGDLCSSGDTKLEEALRDINNWLNNNPKEVVLLVLMDQMDHSSTRQNAAAMISNEIGDKAFTPSYDFNLDGKSCHTLPLNDSSKVTKRKLLESGNQIIITTETKQNCGGLWRKLVWNVNVDVYMAGEGQPKNSGSMTNDKWIFIPEDRLFGTLDGKKQLSRGEAGAAANKGANVIGLDFPSTVNRHKSLIWSWDNNEPSTSKCGSNCCAVQRPWSKWKAVSCDNTYRFACQNESGTWSVTFGTGKFSEGQKMCNKEGKGNFSVPVNGNYNFQLWMDFLRNFIFRDNVFVAYKKVDGMWKAQVP